MCWRLDSHSGRMINSNIFTFNTRHIAYQFFNYTWTEMSWTYQHCQPETAMTVVIPQQSPAELHLQSVISVIKTLDVRFNEDRVNIREMEMSLSFSLSCGREASADILRKDNININASPSNMTRLSFFLPLSVVFKTFRLWCGGRLWFQINPPANCLISLTLWHIFFSWFAHKEDFAFQARINQQDKAINQHV